MRGAVACATLLALCACQGRPEVKACEALLMPSLKAPSTYKLVEAASSKAKDGTTSVFIQYDAVNSYNAPIRSTFACKVDAEGIAANAESEAKRDVEEAARIALEPEPSTKPVERDEPKPAIDLEEVPVCDRPDSEEKRELMNEIGTDCMGE